jgi:hypothetical protein
VRWEWGSRVVFVRGWGVNTYVWGASMGKGYGGYGIGEVWVWGVGVMWVGCGPVGMV